MPKCSIHPFCLETYDTEATVHARHFSSPYSGTVEDPVTGTASGVIGAYYMTYVQESNDERLVVEQGNEINRPGKVYVKVGHRGNDIKVEICGHCCYNKVMEVSYGNAQ